MDGKRWALCTAERRELNWRDSATQNFVCTVCGPGLYVFAIMRSCTLDSVFVGPCHHGMARPPVADGGTASDMEGSCK